MPDLGRSRATLHRHRNPRPLVHGPRRPFHHPAELSDAEREQALAAPDAPRFADKSPGQVWAVLLDEGVYLCSQATMYRLLRERGQSGERRAQAVRPATTKPELEADGPNQVWSWDITKLKGPVRGVYYLLYVIIDIFSRKSCTPRSGPPRTAPWPRSSSKTPSPPTTASHPRRSTPTAARR